MGRLDGKVAIITGAARGQGAEEARRFVSEGASVVLADVLDDEGRATAAELGGRAAYHHLDVSDPSDWARVVEAASERFGPVDVLVNNAGIIRFGTIASLSVEDARAMFEVNQLGTLLGMQAVIPGMSELGRGSIVNISSVDGINPMVGTGGYAATKFAIRGLTRVGALELGPLGIRVNSVHPGGVATPMNGAEALGFDVAPMFSSAPLGRIGQPEDVAPLVVFLASDESGYCTGSEFVVDGGVIAGHRLG
jgi:3alpha(or 20beta)-hydroxysteroid dehydrogenase